ncbi:hypothetical protein HYQ40_08495 [Aerococcaceae bacterium DSM 111021]|nr:hypothetical protein [Aerococcaceae bacterium DSM 111021]
MEALNKPQTTFINSATIKIIAMVSMMIDHLGAFVLLPWLQAGNGQAHIDTWSTVYTTSRSIGRLAFPLFCFLIVEGFKHTSDVKKYMMRLGIFALISEIPFDLARSHTFFDFSGQNVMFTLLFGLIAIWCIKHFDNLFYRLIGVALSLIIVTVLNTDYSSLGVSVLIILYVLRDFRLFQSLLGAFAFIGSWFAMPAFIITYFYNGLKGSLSSKAFYWFYPVHLLLYSLIAYFLIS